MSKYNGMELMICLASRYLENDSTVILSTGAQCAAAMLAQKTRAPQLLILFEAGGIGPLLVSMPLSVGDSRTYYRGLASTSMTEIMETCQRGMIDYNFAEAAQIDMFGNINSIDSDPYEKPGALFTSRGGSNDLASFCWKTMVIMPHDQNRFTNNINLITSPGFLTGKGAREKAGLPADSGPYKIITNLAVLGFEKENCRMRVESVHPDVTREQIIENTDFELLWAEEIFESVPPSEQELEILRTEIDPRRDIIGRSQSPVKL